MVESTEQKFQQIVEADAKGQIDFTDPCPTNFTGKRVLITGGASGIGAAAARMFASQGAHVIIADLDAAAGKALAAELQQHFVTVDVASWQSQVAMFTAALKLLPGEEIDTLITSAGVRGSATWNMEPCSPSDLHDGAEQMPPPSTSCLDIGLTGCMNTVHLGVKYAMGLNSEQHRDKSVILLGSFAGYTGIADRPDYTAAKWGVRGLFRCLRQTLLPLGARANLLAPYFVETPMTSSMVEVLKKRGVQLGDMDMVMKAMARMAADPYVNGRAVTITSEGCHDMCDDAYGVDAGKAVNDLKERGVTIPQASATIARK